MDISRHEGDVDSRSSVCTVEDGRLQVIIVDSSQQRTANSQINDLGMLICIQKTYLCIATTDLFLGMSCLCTLNFYSRLAKIAFYCMEEAGEQGYHLS